MPLCIVLISGSTRAGSTTTAALRTAVEIAPADVSAVLYEGLPELPAFSPDDDDDPPGVVRDLRAQLATADVVVFCTPEYAGTLPGSFKNLLDWTVGSGELYAKPVAWINVAAEGRGEGADATLQTVLGYVGARPIDEACVQVPVPRNALTEAGTVDDSAFRAGLLAVLETIRASLSDAGRPSYE